MNPETERLLQQDLRIRRAARAPGQFLLGIFLVLGGLMFGAAIYRVIASAIGFE